MSVSPRKARFEATLEQLRNEVGHHAGGTDMLPGERALSARLAVSRTTLRRMLTLLVDEGVLVHRHGVGTFVRSRRADASPIAAAPERLERTAIAGFTEAVRRLGRAASSDTLDRRHRLPTPREAMLLGCPAHARVLQLNRLRRVDGEVVVRECAILPSWALSGDRPVDGSLYEALSASGTTPVRSLQRMRVGLGSADDLVAFGIAAPNAVVRLRRVDYVADGRCCVYTETVLRADWFDLLVETCDGVPPFGLSIPAERMGTASRNG